MLRRPIVLILVVAVITAACGSQPETCGEAADETIVLMQDLIDEVEAEFESMTIQDFLALMAAGEELPSVTRFEERANALSDRLAELGCTSEEFEADVAARTDQLHATNDIGRFLLNAIQSGGL